MKLKLANLWLLNNKQLLRRSSTASMPGLYHVLGSGTVLVCGLLGNWNLKLQVETTQQEQQPPCERGLGRRTWILSPRERSRWLCLLSGLCNLAAGLQFGYAYPKSHPPRGAGGDSPLWIIIPDTFLIAVLSVSFLHGLQIQSDWKKQAFKRFKSWPISYTNTLILQQSSIFVACFFSVLL